MTGHPDKHRGECAWCGRQSQWDDGPPITQQERDERLVTHGICVECRDIFDKEIEREKWKRTPAPAR